MLRSRALLRTARGRAACAFRRQIHRTPQLRMASEKLAPARRVAGLPKNLWVEFGALAVQTKAVNLGQGMPDFAPPQFLIDALAEASKEAKFNQYTRSQGHPRLVTALAAMYGLLMNRQIDPMTEVLVSLGAYSCLSHAMNAFLQEDDEVILIEPFFDCYQPMAKIAGAQPIFVPLRLQVQHATSSKDWALDPAELASAFSPRTKMIIINNPNNPLGKVFAMEELEVIAELCKKHDVICVMDEVYEWLTYSGSKHLRAAALPGMWDRTITIGSGGKTFSATGWKTGWALGPEHLIKHLQTVHANTGYTFVTGIQEAMARGVELETSRLGQPGSYFKELPEMLEKKRDEMAEVLRGVGLNPILPEGGYFMMADTSPLGVEFPSGEEAYDFQFAKWMTREKGVATIPSSAFFCPEHAHLVEKFVRFCFIKEEKTLQAAYAKLKEWAKERETSSNQ